VLETALLLAKKRGSYIEGFPLRFGISEFVAVDPAGSIPLESYRQESAEEAAQARKLFDTFMQQPACRLQGRDRRAVSWIILRLARRRAPRARASSAATGGVFDITVLSRPDANTIGLHKPRDRIRPVRERPADPVVAAGAAQGHRHQRHDPWNCSTERPARRRPPCRCCRRPSASPCSRWRAGRRAGTDRGAIAHAFAAHTGIAAKPMTVVLEGKPPRRGDPARWAKAEGCDLLVKGAFTQSRLRQMIFGGATSHILANAELPVADGALMRDRLILNREFKLRSSPRKRGPRLCRKNWVPASAGTNGWMLPYKAVMHQFVAGLVAHGRATRTASSPGSTRRS